MVIPSDKNNIIRADSIISTVRDRLIVRVVCHSTKRNSPEGPGSDGAGGACDIQIRHSYSNAVEEHGSNQKLPSDSTRAQQTAFGVTTVTWQVTSDRPLTWQTAARPVATHETLWRKVCALRVTARRCRCISARGASRTP